MRPWWSDEGDQKFELQSIYARASRSCRRKCPESAPHGATEGTWRDGVAGENGVDQDADRGHATGDGQSVGNYPRDSRSSRPTFPFVIGARGRTCGILLLLKLRIPVRAEFTPAKERQDGVDLCCSGCCWCQDGVEGNRPRGRFLISACHWDLI